MTAALTWALLAASAVVGLAALLRMSGPPAGGAEMRESLGLPEQVTATIVTLFALAALVFLVDVGRRLRLRRRRDDEDAALDREAAPPPAWKRTLTQLALLLYFVTLAYLLARSGISLAGLLALGQLGGALGAGDAGQASAMAPAAVTWTFGAVGVAAGLGALGLALWAALGDRLAGWWTPAPPAEAPPPEPLAEAVEESVQDLRAEPDARRAINRCYARFERAAAGSGLARLPWRTPAEFLRDVLAGLPVPRVAAITLTELFERARYSEHPVGAAERDRALGALDEIAGALARARRERRARETDLAVAWRGAWPGDDDPPP